MSKKRLKLQDVTSDPYYVAEEDIPKFTLEGPHDRNDDWLNLSKFPSVDWDDFNPRIEYKYSENRLINELQLYVDQTYGEHYSKNKYQATEFIIDAGHGMSFCLGNVLKYAQRYGHKDGHNRKDLMKVLHYALIALHCHDLEYNDDSI